MQLCFYSYYDMTNICLRSPFLFPHDLVLFWLSLFPSPLSLFLKHRTFATPFLSLSLMSTDVQHTWAPYLFPPSRPMHPCIFLSLTSSYHPTHPPQDGTRFEGFAFGAERSAAGETVFQTGMVGYPESLTGKLSALAPFSQSGLCTRSLDTRSLCAVC